jgi:hypothetical protein
VVELARRIRRHPAKGRRHHVIAHVAGLPVEETLLPLLTGVSAGLLLARAWIVSRLRRPRTARHDRPQDADGPLV